MPQTTEDGDSSLTMTEGKENESEDQDPSRRTFLKVSAAAGAAVAALVAGANFIPTLSSAAKSAATTPPESPAASSVPNADASGEPLIVVLRGNNVDIYKGESKFPVSDANLSRQLTSALRGRMVVE